MVIARQIHPDTLAAISNPAGFFPIVLFFVDWPEDPFHAHTNLGTVSWDGHDWTGVGKIAGLSLPGDGVGMAAQEASLSLLGLGDELDAHLDVDARDREAVIYFGAVTACDGDTLVGEPFPIFTGTINGLRDLTEANAIGRTRGVQVPLSSGPSQRARSTAYHSFEDQAANHLGDTAGRLLINTDREGLRLRWPA
ncbi:hypothetical protein SAMN04488105_110241 [Salipiger thiooxidans]|uniref:Uncharacterized protein n=1 Tax=Salipiger thiooxidans TaxID=282683 RepID=A0A1G7HDX6_9RHOB|nr:hypothetical protein [Salipiger thiooxidans]SDE98571.1 hypothetical protein SAMN04488105_110241 [Salipiger thiooxidans]